GGPTFLGLPGVQGYVLLAELTAAVLLGVGVVLVLLRRRRQTPPDAAPPAGSTSELPPTRPPE
ncbi:MAG: hypothetical protein ACREDE_09590, partial [Thermoplasmata archaeon]